MSKMSKAVSEKKEYNKLRREETVMNFMGGDSYKINPLDTLKIVTASSIFGEPAYYRDGGYGKKAGIYRVSKAVGICDDILSGFDGKNTVEIMESVIDSALSFDFKGTLEWAVKLRNEFFIRLNPQIIMVRAAIHPERKKFTDENPGLFDAYNQKVMSRADEPMTQIAYYLYKNNGNKNNMPNILKKSLAKKLSSLKAYQIHKYKNHEIGMIDAVRITHATSANIGRLMKDGDVPVKENSMTWENMRSAGNSWKKIFRTIDMGHMALLRNIRGVFTEVDDFDFCKEYMEKLKSGVKDGKQFPFRYYSAYETIASDKNVNHKPLILDTLEECIDISVNNMPKLKGKTMCLSDNSGSAWGTFNSEYGSNTVAVIDNLSSVITAMCSEEGYVGKFGDKLKVYPIIKRKGALSQTKEISSNRDNNVGGGTEGGIWLFFKKAIEEKQHWDNIFIYSDQQAGTGGLYGTISQYEEYKKDFSMGVFGEWSSYINVYALIQEYRKKVNPKVNVFSIQTAGYDNMVIPEMAYRCDLMYGWTGKEALYADAKIKLWNEIDSNK